MEAINLVRKQDTVIAMVMEMITGMDMEEVVVHLWLLTLHSFTLLVT